MLSKKIFLISTIISLIHAQKPIIITNNNESTTTESIPFTVTSSIEETTLESEFDEVIEKVSKSKMCLALFNLSDKRFGCLISFAMTFNASLQQCSEYNMTLLDVRSDCDRDMLFEQSKKFFSIGGGTVLYINGKYSSDDNVWLRQPNNEKLQWTNEVQSPLKRFEGHDEYCLVVYSGIGTNKYEIASIRCKNACYFFCQFEQE
ncbi:hypothetical protein PVAND_009681 [Polypedilum vanderplanki]|uniref:C-type lectin domain-containing protein n=1 Tax=Polypedilum vanderplanki TaxID=319348 RepID=A0A9J6CDH6_POLVA|nr:hypothetical protein PVAND_009681 [Polypedilum vanderplanki]